MEVLTKDLQRDTEQETHLCQLMHQWEDETHDVTAQGVVHHSVFNGRLQFKKENPCLHCQEAHPLSSNKTQWLHMWLQDAEKKGSIAWVQLQEEPRVCMVNNLVLPTKANSHSRMALNGTSPDAHMKDEAPMSFQMSRRSGVP